MSFFSSVKKRIRKWLGVNQEDQKDMQFPPQDESLIQKTVSTELEPQPTAPLIISKSIPYQVIHRYDDSRFWTWTERLRGNQSRLTQEKFIPEIECKDQELVRHFGSSQPPSFDVLLHFLPSAQKKHPNPILLIHGAGHNANEAWCESAKQQKGLLYSLSYEGYDVFGVTFAHSHGDNWQQAIQLANCIHRIREVAEVEKLDVIAHSKGGISTWIYLAGLCSRLDAAYEGAVRRYVMLGTPNRGLDFPFRNLSANWSVIQMGISAPVACDSMLYFGKYMDTTERSLYRDGGAFPGSSQLLYRWDDKYPVRMQAKTLYYGGQNMLIHSRGIDTAIREGEQLIEILFAAPINPQIEAHVLAGNYPYFDGVRGELDAESDGLVFVESVLSTEGIAPALGQVKRKDVLPLNHLDLLYHEEAQQWVLESLC